MTELVALAIGLIAGFVIGWIANLAVSLDEDTVAPIATPDPPLPVDPPYVEPEPLPKAPGHLVTVHFMDDAEKKVVFTTTMDNRLRRPTLMRKLCGQERKYMAARQAPNGDWIYREVSQ